MNLNIKRVAGLVREYERIDHILRSQGFTCKKLSPPVYDIRLQDNISGRNYRLRIPTKSHNDHHVASPLLLQLGTPTIDRPRGNIPDSIIEAANQVLAEIVSYLLPNPPTLPSI
ncbi:hypothetical protein [Marininema halotolerans]|uniref:YugN-like family protein n=1 Tax=Marininema halotolerans TaxID=1155944 RepID=A0A1I6SS62_9BACL|nr:hypothetical protein [Marininema halotolerans]SFS79785.1 hypothetical protein SAMN05444972_1082 [Marininema halotolerans]